MSNDHQHPQQHAQGWRLVGDGTPTSGQRWIDASDAHPALLLAHDSQGEWWAVAPQCRQCGVALAGAFAQAFAQETAEAATVSGFDEIGCTQCGATHGPAVADCECVALMIVEDEIYAAPAGG